MDLPTDRLSQMIARLCAQRACLDFARSAIATLPGPVLEIGLGKGRTYDYLKFLFPDREIFAFDRSVHCPDAVRPDPDHLVLGDFRMTLGQQAERLGKTVALAHADIGSADPRRDEALSRAVAPLIGALVKSRGLVVADRPMPGQRWEALPAPAGTGDWPYFIYRVP